MEFVWVPSGCFQMGRVARKQPLLKNYAEDDYRKWFDREVPRHEVCLDGFWMGKYEVTNRQYRIYNPEHTSEPFSGYFLDGDNQPVSSVSWDEAIAFSQWLIMQHEGKAAFHLPTEAQWEYAARAGTTTHDFWGDNLTDACLYANVVDQAAEQGWEALNMHHCNDGYAVAAPVGSFRPNDFGLFDMLGNVWEWCEDVYNREAYKHHQRYNPNYQGSGRGRVIRGGGWGLGLRPTRTSDRFGNLAEHRSVSRGVRLVISVE
jgi:formylglycine-generating enzyme required for sulfatase activity